MQKTDCGTAELHEGRLNDMSSVCIMFLNLDDDDSPNLDMDAQVICNSRRINNAPRFWVARRRSAARSNLPRAASHPHTILPVGDDSRTNNAPDTPECSATSISTFRLICGSDCFILEQGNAWHSLLKGFMYTKTSLELKLKLVRLALFPRRKERRESRD